jgi:hypothetical protein
MKQQPISRIPVIQLDFLIKIFLADLVFLCVFTQVYVYLAGISFIFHLSGVLKIILFFFVLFSILFTGSALLIDFMSREFRFQNPRSILWFMPLVHMTVSGALFICILYFLPFFTNPWFWSEITGLDMTRVRSLVILLYSAFTMNSVIMVFFSILFYFRYHVIFQMVKKFPNPSNSVIQSNPSRVIMVMCFLLIGLMVYVMTLSPDYFELWKIKLAYRINRNAEVAVVKGTDFLNRYPQSRFATGVQYFLGKLYFRQLGKLENAERYLEVFCSNGQDHVRYPEAVRDLVEVKLSLGKKTRAVELLEAFQRTAPENPLLDDVLMELARYYFKTGDGTSLGEIYERIERDYSHAVLMKFDQNENFVSSKNTMECVGELHRRAGKNPRRHNKHL